MAAGAVVVNSSSLKVYVSRKDSGISRHGRWSILSFLVRSCLFKLNNSLTWKVCDIIHADDLSFYLRGLKYSRIILIVP